MKGYKAYGKGLKCKGFQYEVGKEYKHEGEINPCQSGFHFCENPLDVLDFYDLTECEFSEVEATGKTKTDDNKKTVTDKIKIGAKLDLPAFIKASFDFLWERCKAKEKDNGYYSQLASSGDSSKLASSGDSSQLASSGYYSQLEMQGEKSVGANIGINGIIKGKKGCWITLAEYGDNNEIKFVASAKIDGKKIKENTWYKLKNKKFVEVK